MTKGVLTTLIAYALVSSGCDKQPVDAIMPDTIDNTNSSIEFETDASIDLIESNTADTKSNYNEPFFSQNDHFIFNTTNKSAGDTKGNNLVKLPISCRNNAIVQASKQKLSKKQVKGCGRVVGILNDVNEGSRHQRFIVKLDDIYPEHTVLIAHNIDIATRVDNLQEGNSVIFYGVYEYNERGGIVHWTHKDPAKTHQNGWIEKDGIRYK